VKFTAATVESHYHACHCTTCRRWGSGPLFCTTATGVRFKGVENLVRYKSSDWAERGFCKNCGSHLFYWLKAVDQYSIGAGCFDEGDSLELSREIFIDQKPDSYALTGDHPRLTAAEVFAEFSVRPPLPQKA
jgi:hypothetical protein